MLLSKDFVLSRKAKPDQLQPEDRLWVWDSLTDTEKAFFTELSEIFDAKLAHVEW